MIKVYSTKNCRYCKLAKEFLSEHGVNYVEVKIDEDREALEDIVNRSGQMAVPIIENEGKFVVGFNKDKIKELL